MADRPLPAYDGDEPYIFVSYSHEEAESVYDEMAWIHDAGINLWYDDGIHVGSVWRRALAESLENASGLLFFCSERSCNSEHCLKELSFALDESKDIFVVRLDDAKLPAELRLSLNDRQALVKSEMEEAVYRDRLLTALQSVMRPSEPVENHTHGIDPPSIVVEPFQALGNEKTLVYFAQSVSEAVLAILSKRPWRIVAGQLGDLQLPASQVGGCSAMFAMFLVAPCKAPRIEYESLSG